MTDCSKTHQDEYFRSLLQTVYQLLTYNLPVVVGLLEQTVVVEEIDGKVVTPSKDIVSIRCIILTFILYLRMDLRSYRSSVKKNSTFAVVGCVGKIRIKNVQNTTKYLMNQLVAFFLFEKNYILHSIFETSYYVKLCIAHSQFVISI